MDSIAHIQSLAVMYIVPQSEPNIYKIKPKTMLWFTVTASQSLVQPYESILFPSIPHKVINIKPKNLLKSLTKWHYKWSHIHDYPMKSMMIIRDKTKFFQYHFQTFSVTSVSSYFQRKK